VGNSIMTLNVILAVLAALAGLALLFGSWDGRIAARWLPVPAGWALLVLSGGFWVAGTGTEFGISLALLATSAVAWLFVVANRQQRRRRDRGEASPPKPVAQRRTLAHHAILFLLVVPLAAVASTLVSVALSMAMPLSTIDAMVTVLVIMPILWGCAAYWTVADSRTVRPAAAMVLSAAVSAALIYV
jgi:hypothetical protein